MTTKTLHITRRGRLVLSTLVATPVLAVSLLLASPGALADNAPAENDFDYVTVLSGDTLWTLAEQVDPAGDPRDVVAEIMALNGLRSAHLTPGQDIAIPR
jgi:nucleoid-associated protein YgaU